MRFLITGHTGFKGSWLSLWLAQGGHSVAGLALDPAPGSLFESADIAQVMSHDIRGDIRDASIVTEALKATAPEVLIHMAAQPLVRDSYVRPRWTFETNVMGTLNLLEAAGTSPSLRAQVVVTTDKVYRNVNRVAGYTESDPLGGDDPYSASKAMADLLTQSWVHSFPKTPTAIARAGNVIGGGDVSKDRLIPDIVTSLRAGRTPTLRYPQAVRPWQHVLDCLHGYRMLVDQIMAEGTAPADAGTWNFGPDEESFVSVGALTRTASARWGVSAPWSESPPDYHEAGLLALDSTKAKQSMGWRNYLPFEEAVHWTMDWYRAVDDGASPRSVTESQIQEFDRLIEHQGY